MSRRGSASRKVLFLGAAFVWLCISVVMFWGSGEEEAEPKPPSTKEKAALPEEPNQEPFEAEGTDAVVKEDEAEQAREETKQVAARFIRAYLSFDAKDPEKKLKEVRPYLSSTMAEGWEGLDYPDGIKKAKVLKVETAAGAEDVGDWVWTVKAQTETTFDRGGAEKAWSMYEVVVGIEDDKWVVEEVNPGGDAGAEPLQIGGIEEE
ncbi:hypothetical protein [Kroppenstedtia eburnea]|uniref:Uncharacterized protein n=1 Tax=Kroppenstedtia eburnea TaxID=714067 RepID=A0A1N7JFR6_9BACL|nr:hypothetical protein [Kroppenstedtia eburnea]QKI80589.1 hypothetical protein GXN75_00315 [Kroppenstedtia eburnea]SIS48101.1 hypothetical protein SAMN05421790_10234 [Kroppenstedtia eburnea]